MLNKIFADSEILSKLELEKYLKAKVTNEEIAKIEKKIQNNPLNSEAIDGYLNNPDSINDLTDIQKKLKAKYKTSFSWQTFISIFIILLGLGITTYYLFKIYIQNEKQIVQIANPVDSTIKNSIFINENFYNKSEQTNKNFKEKITTTTKYDKINQTNARTTEQIEKIPSITSLDCLKLEINSGIKLLNRPIVNTIYIHDLKVVDYRGLRKKNTAVNSGLSSAFENKSNTENKADDYIAEQPYIDFLSNVLKLFNSNDYKAANREFNVILTYFTDDANAIFYSGLSCFQMADYEKAEKRFIQMLNHSYNTFYEESQWYLSQTYILSGKKKEAINLLKKISGEDGFYSQRAKDKLDAF